MSSETVVQQIQRRIKEAMKSGNVVEKEILRVALGEIQMNEVRAADGAKATDEEAIAIVRKLVKSNEETLAATATAEGKAVLAKENEILATLLPKTLDAAAIAAALADVKDAVKAAPNDGAATGVAMKAAKAKGLAVTGKDVAEAVKLLRG